MSYLVPLIPISKNITKDNLADNFDERTIINDDLNMAGYKIYNLKDPVDDYDAVTKYYVDTKIYNINSANIIGNLPWNRLINVPSYFASKTSLLEVDSVLNFGSFLPVSSTVPTQNNQLVNKLYVDNKTAGAVSNYNQVLPATGNTAGPVGNSTNPITFTVGNSSRTDANLSVNGKITNLQNPTNNADAANKSYVDSQVVSLSNVPPYSPYIFGWFDTMDFSSVSTVISSGNYYVNYWFNKMPTACSHFYNTGSTSSLPVLWLGNPGYYLHFNGSSSELNANIDIRPFSTSNNACNTVTIFVVNRVTTTITDNMCVFSSDAGSYGRYFGYDSRDGSTDRTNNYSPACFTGSSNGYCRKFRRNGTPVSVTPGVWYLSCFSYYPQVSVNSTNPACSAWLDGIKLIEDYACIGQSANTSVSIGYNLYSNSGYFNGDISEIIIYNKILSNTERQNVEQYLKNKWNLPFSYA